MRTIDESVENLPSPLLALFVNDKREPYFVKIHMPNRKKAGEFLLRMWQVVMGSQAPRDAEDALGEWTDRARDVRSTYDGYAICIRTHAWHPSGDHHILHESVLAFLKNRGMDLQALTE